MRTKGKNLGKALCPECGRMYAEPSIDVCNAGCDVPFFIGGANSLLDFVDIADIGR